MQGNLNIGTTGAILFKGGKFYLKAANGLYDLASEDYSIFLLPLLEKKPLEFFNLLETNNEYDTMHTIVLRLLKCPFEKRMEYWADKALDWVASMDFNKDLSEWSKKIDTDWMSQKMKHRFWKTFKITSR